MAKDPICGMELNLAKAKYSTSQDGETYYFCSSTCKSRFEKNLLSYAKKKGWFTRLLESIAKANAEKFGDTPPSCCSRK